MTKFILNDKQQFKQYQLAFRQLAHTKQATAVDHILYNLLRGKDLKRGFTPITNETKLNNNARKEPEWYTFKLALSELIFSISGAERRKTWFATYGGRVPVCLYYGEIITQDQWIGIQQALEERK